MCCAVWHGSIAWGAPLRSYIPLWCLISGMRWRCYGAVIRSNVAQAVL
nr:MAG TPA: hypothetical protein [Caudoviricetes sp.]